jgi:hypothetical protein
MSREVMFVCSNQNHAHMFTAVAHVLMLGGGASPMFVALDAYYHHEAAPALQQDSWSGVTVLARPSGAVDTPWTGWPFAFFRLAREGRRAAVTLLEQRQPAAVVLGNDLGIIERTFIGEGRRLGIPSLLVQDGVVALGETCATAAKGPTRLLQDVLTVLGVHPSSPKCYGQNGANRIAVMGPAVARWLVSQGVPSGRIAVTGQPCYDRLFELREGLTQPESREALGLPAEQRIVLFSSQPYLRYRLCDEATARCIWQTVIEGVRGLGAGHRLVAKLHPAEDLEFTRKWLGDAFPREWTLTRDADVFSLTWHADVVVTVASTTALEAIYLGKPVVVLSAGLGRLPLPYVASGAALEAEGAVQLTARLREALYAPETRKRLAAAGSVFVTEYACVDGRASERVAIEIFRLARA